MGFQDDIFILNHTPEPCLNIKAIFPGIGLSIMLLTYLVYISRKGHEWVIASNKFMCK